MCYDWWNLCGQLSTGRPVFSINFKTLAQQMAFTTGWGPRLMVPFRGLGFLNTKNANIVLVLLARPVLLTCLSRTNAMNHGIGLVQQGCNQCVLDNWGGIRTTSGDFYRHHAFLFLSTGTAPRKWKIMSNGYMRTRDLSSTHIEKHPEWAKVHFIYFITR